MLYNCSRDADRFVKINAAFGLKFIDHKKAIPYLKGLFIDPDDQVRAMAHQSLNHIKVSRKQMLNNSTDPVQESLELLLDNESRLLDKSEEEVFQEILQATRSKNFQIRSHGVLRLIEYQYPPEEIVQTLISLYLNEEDQFIKTDIENTLSSMDVGLIKNSIDSLDLSQEKRKKIDSVISQQ